MTDRRWRIKNLLLQIKTSHNDHHEIARGILWVSLFICLGKIVGATKEMAIAYRYGISPEVDAYLYIFNLASWPVSVWSSILTVVLVPITINIQKKPLVGIAHFRAELLGFTILISGSLMLLEWLGLPTLVNSTLIGLPVESVKIASHMTFGLSLIIPLGMTASLFSTWILSRGRQVNSLFECLPASGLLLFIVLSPSASAQNLIWGTVSGYILYVIVILIYFNNTEEIEWPRLSYKSQHWTPFWRGFSIIIIGQALMSFMTIIDQFFAAHMDVGSISTVNYANRILGIFTSLGVLTISRATLPVFSKNQEKSTEKLRHLKTIGFRWTWFIFGISLVLLLILWILSPNIVKLLFERGAFTPKNTLEVSDLLRIYLIQLPFYCSGIVLVSLLASQQWYLLIAFSGISNLFFKILSNWILVPFMGIYGIAMSTYIMYIFSLLLLYLLINFKFSESHTVK